MGETLGDRVAALREKRGLTLSALAKAAGISKAYLHKIESGRSSRPSGEILHRLAAVLGASVAQLLGVKEGNSTTAVRVSQSLREFASEAELSEDDVHMLARIRHRGRQPASVDDWRFLYESIKRAVSDAGD
ncbi:MAG: helix-turn-helix domain-containing protein [Armatimonadota bacterium]